MNHEASVVGIAPTTEPPVITMFESGKEKENRPWFLTLHPSHLTLADAPGVQPYVILRDQLMKTAVLHEGIRCFSIEQPRKIIFKLERADVARLADWIGVTLLCQFFLRRRFSLILPWACLWILGGLVSLLPSPDGRPGPRFQVASIVWGLVLVGAWAMAKWRPHPGLFLVDALWFSWVGINLALSVWHGRSRWWLLLVVLLVWMGLAAFKHFFRFRRVRFSAEAAKIL
jgi:hypothetical protein